MIITKRLVLELVLVPMKRILILLCFVTIVFANEFVNNWQPVDYPGHGQVTVRDGEITLASGRTVTGVCWQGEELPISNYEISYEAMRTHGDDFFCALTFPVDSSFATLVLGGWRGNVTGLSCINGVDASQNFTGKRIILRNKQWYHIRLRVTDESVLAWLDERPILQVDRQDGELSLRGEMDLFRPLGFASWKSSGVIRNIVLQNISE